MAEAGAKGNSNGEVLMEKSEDSRESLGSSPRRVTLYSILNRFVSSILFPDHDSAAASASLFRRIKISVIENGPLFQEACKNSSLNLLLWTRRGSPLRALLVISVGTITLLALTGFLVFMLFFLTATINAVVISLLISLAAAGGFLAFFFACMTAIYIGALSVAAFVISCTTVSTIIAAMIVTGWIGFFWTVWLVAMKVMGLASHSFSIAGSAISSYSPARRTRGHRHHEMKKAD